MDFEESGWLAPARFDMLKSDGADMLQEHHKVFTAPVDVIYKFQSRSFCIALAAQLAGTRSKWQPENGPIESGLSVEPKEAIVRIQLPRILNDPGSELQLLPRKSWVLDFLSQVSQCWVKNVEPVSAQERRNICDVIDRAEAYAKLANF